MEVKEGVSGDWREIEGGMMDCIPRSCLGVSETYDAFPSLHRNRSDYPAHHRVPDSLVRHPPGLVVGLEMGADMSQVTTGFKLTLLKPLILLRRRRA